MAITGVSPGRNMVLISCMPEAEQRTKSGIVLSTQIKATYYRYGIVQSIGEGPVVGTGTGFSFVPPAFSVGDKVIFRADEREQITILGSQHYLTDLGAVLASYTEE